MYKKHILKNGITLLMEPMKETRAISMCIFVKNGSANENVQNNGISHFIEHMLFKGTENLSNTDIADEMDSIGAVLNAYTSFEHTCFYFKVLDEYFDTALGVLSDMYLHPKFGDEEIEKEKGVVIEEINMAEDSPDDIVFEKLQTSILEGTPYSQTILGSRENVRSFDRKALFEYYNAHYRTDNTVISIAGNFDAEDTKKKIEAVFEQKASVTPPQESNFSLKNKVCFKATEKDIEQLHLCITFPGISVLDKDRYTLTAMNTILGGGMSSLLFRKIREENGLAYSIYSFPTSFSDTGLYSIYTALNSEQLLPAFKLIAYELKSFKEKEADEKTINKVKVQLKNTTLLSFENSANRASFIGRCETVFGRIHSLEYIEKEIDSITASAVNSLANSIFKSENMSISLVGRNAEKLLKALLDEIPEAHTHQIP